jgi:hypothetical protein
MICVAVRSGGDSPEQCSAASSWRDPPVDIFGGWIMAGVEAVADMSSTRLVKGPRIKDAYDTCLTVV